MEGLHNSETLHQAAPFKNPFSKGWVDTSTAARFIPRGPIDILRDCLRRVVFRVDCRSATSISAIMLDDLTEKQILALIEDFNTAAKTINKLNVRNFWSAQHNELLKRSSPEFARLQDVVEKYRLVHADQLYQLKMVDVDIRFEHATLATYTADVKTLQEKNAKIYHYWPELKGRGQPTWPQTLRISVIAKSKTIDELFLHREENGEVEISANTKPAPRSEAAPSEVRLSPRLCPGLLFPYNIPDISKLPMAALDPAAQETVRKRIDEVCSRPPLKPTLLANQKKNKNDGCRWHLYNSSRTMERDAIRSLEQLDNSSSRPPKPELPARQLEDSASPEHRLQDSKSEIDQLQAAKAVFTVNYERLAAMQSHLAFLRRHGDFSVDREADVSTIEGLRAELNRLADETEDMRLRIIDLEEQTSGTGWSRPGDFIFDMDEEPRNDVVDEEECCFKVHPEHCRPWWPARSEFETGAVTVPENVLDEDGITIVGVVDFLQDEEQVMSGALPDGDDTGRPAESQRYSDCIVDVGSVFKGRLAMPNAQCNGSKTKAAVENAAECVPALDVANATQRCDELDGVNETCGECCVSSFGTEDQQYAHYPATPRRRNENAGSLHATSAPIPIRNPEKGVPRRLLLQWFAQMNFPR